jgi:hypothetical protein
MSTYSAWCERELACARADDLLQKARESARLESRMHEEAQFGDPVGTNASSVQVAGSHYKDMAIQPAEYVTRNKLGFLQGNAIKYISRAGRKGPAAEDIRKAIHCLELLLEYTNGNDNTDDCGGGEGVGC